MFFIANSADPDEMLHHVAFLLDLHCLPKYLFTSIQNEKGAVLNVLSNIAIILMRKRELVALH